ncbi:MAG: hypothetical protein Q8880_08315 [Bacteroidota bacterium]|nr:hypothetical protein [Bacteroidota bacterium]
MKKIFFLIFIILSTSVLYAGTDKIIIKENYIFKELFNFGLFNKEKIKERQKRRKERKRERLKKKKERKREREKKRKEREKNRRLRQERRKRSVSAVTKRREHASAKTTKANKQESKSRKTLSKWHERIITNAKKGKRSLSKSRK